MMSDRDYTKELFGELRSLVIATCTHPPNSLSRCLGLTKLIRIIQQSGKLWQERSLEYEDALQLTWIYFCRNLCEAVTGDRYDEEKASVITWLNAYLKRRLQDCRIETENQKRWRSMLPLNQDREYRNPIDNLAAAPDLPPILTEIKDWVNQDPGGKLRRLHIRDRPEINCQVLILRRLPPETPWEVLAKEFQIKNTTLSSFYSRHCLKLLREFGKQQGYI
ncbi:MAG: sigma-70 family RNA polymerase sigma factor [Phormidium sp.]